MGIWRYMATLKKDRKQLYPFKTIEIGGTITIKAAKYNSFCTAYRQHNKKHEPIEFETETVGNNIIATRIEPEVTPTP